MSSTSSGAVPKLCSQRRAQALRVEVVVRAKTRRALHSYLEIVAEIGEVLATDEAERSVNLEAR